ncbi:MAG: peptide-N-glycosidase [Flavobacterium sp.]|nr:peptide-N-glycosidase [Candidatus Neoflavobacterium equi]
MSEKRYFIILLCFCFGLVTAQDKKNSTVIEYHFYNQNTPSDEPYLYVAVNGSTNKIWRANEKTNDQVKNWSNTSFVDYKNKLVYQQTQTKEGKIFATQDTLNTDLSSFEFKEEYKSILGYKCQKAVTVIQSNVIELWFTTKPSFKASPRMVGNYMGLVLEISYNGQYSWKAVNIKKMALDHVAFITPDLNTLLSKQAHADSLWKASFTTLQIFKKQQINFNPKVQTDVLNHKYAYGTLVAKKITLPEIKKTTRVFMQLKQNSLGDAYDRTGSVFIIPTEKAINYLEAMQGHPDQLPVYPSTDGQTHRGITTTSEFDPVLELMRFFTPFGIKHYNQQSSSSIQWQDQTQLRQEITNVIHSLKSREIWVGCYIGNYDVGGHQIDLDFTFHQDDTENTNFNFNKPLCNTLNILEMNGFHYPSFFEDPKGLKFDFELQDDVENATLRYITTGHGGWSNGDEFQSKENTIFLNGQRIHQFIPWREDCGSFRSLNPASGNFDNGLSSSDLSRSNWCPGTITQPIYIKLGNLKAGKHQMQITIPQSAAAGANRSYWNVSAVLLGNTK